MSRIFLNSGTFIVTVLHAAMNGPLIKKMLNFCMETESSVVDSVEFSRFFLKCWGLHPWVIYSVLQLFYCGLTQVSAAIIQVQECYFR